MRYPLITIGVCAAGLTLVMAGFDTMMDGEVFVVGDFAFEVLDRGMLVAAMIGVAWLVMRMRDIETEQTLLRSDVARAVAKGEDWRRESRAVLADLGAAIQEQFSAWSLTQAEADIAGLMLKGVSLRDIANLRRTSETTIRQQAQAVYRKSGLSGRVELSAYFLESVFEAREGAMLRSVS